ncbi:hypothetical protein LMH87_011485 [Akanthomyces muscarius]|uniref:Uncharacterized protein n=1 Tax=Akanthomyces muscarius TaxID=2231603 RepID=A0A9W8QBN7_AKAMU|nr:hypothetical protein LMH87_011485 [Akanthomyces muscarius]KAJ4150750.1 hypothetical protein LMH87_011485 [Akanthomyces muscarius]
MVNGSPILIISCGPDPSRYLINDKWASLTQEIAARIEVVWARSVDEIKGKLGYYVPAGILVLDAGFTTSAGDLETVADLLNMYAQMGGTVVFAGVFPAVVEPRALQHIFGAFGLDWSFVGYEVHTGARLNPHASAIADGHLAEQLVSLPSVCELSQLTVKVGSAADALYEIYPQQYERANIESGIVMAKVGDGYVALVGDRENERSTRTTIVAMLKLV